MNTYTVNYNLTSKENTNYILLADFHGDFNLNLAYEIEKMEDSKYIVIAGDLLNNGHDWNSSKKLKQIRNFLDIISKSHKVIIALGNHDLWQFDDKGFKNFKNLEDIKNVYPLYNESLILGHDRFTNFLPNSKTFSYLKQDNRQTVDTIINEYKKSNLSASKDSQYNEHLVAHNPYHFNHDEVKKEISDNYDIIETGHFHDGWIPTKMLDKNYDRFLDKGLHEMAIEVFTKKSTNRLIVEPKRNLSRGVSYIFNDGYVILLPNNQIYYYNKEANMYTLKDTDYLTKRLQDEKVPAVIISGAINTFMKLKMFYPYISNINLTKDENQYNAKRKIKKI